MVAAYSTDTKMVALAGQLKELELAVVEHGGARLIYGGKNGEIKE
jgi:hypothetical protein